MYEGSMIEHLIELSKNGQQEKVQSKSGKAKKK
jgi:hypothetical protein